VVIYCHSMVITKVIYLYNTEWWYYHGMAVNYHGNKFYNIGPWSQCYKISIYCHSTVAPSFCVIKQYCDGNYHGMAVSNTIVIYLGISTLEITGIFIKLAVNYRGIWTLEKVGFFAAVIYRGKLPWYFYNIGPCFVVLSEQQKSSVTMVFSISFLVRFFDEISSE